MKTLYISDLDGTLLNENAELSDRSAQLLNALTARGMHFSVATARTSATVVRMLSALNLRTPAILMNGVCLYDLHENRTIHVNGITPASARAVADAIHTCGAEGFLYTMENGQLATWYEQCTSDHARAFMEERQRKYGKPFTQIADLSVKTDSMIYYSVSDVEEKLLPLNDALQNIPGIRIEFYRDIYRNDHWYLEICSENASKYNALQKLKTLGGYDRVVGFGDNRNDLPLFAACDFRVAVENARDEVKQQADEIIGTNREDSVARWLTEHYQQEVPT